MSNVGRACACVYIASYVLQHTVAHIGGTNRYQIWIIKRTTSVSGHHSNYVEWEDEHMDRGRCTHRRGEVTLAWPAPAKLYLDVRGG